jgi:hypothetical protein
MPLFDFERDPGQRMQRIFYPNDYANWKRRLTQIDPLGFPAIYAHIDGRFSEQAQAPKPLITMSREPGRDWTGTVYEPISPACGHSEEQAAKFLGLSNSHFDFSVCGRPLSLVRRHDGRGPGGAALTAVLVAASRRRE